MQEPPPFPKEATKGKTYDFFIEVSSAFCSLLVIHHYPADFPLLFSRFVPHFYFSYLNGECESYETQNET